MRGRSRCLGIALTRQSHCMCAGCWKQPEACPHPLPTPPLSALSWEMLPSGQSRPGCSFLCADPNRQASRSHLITARRPPLHDDSRERAPPFCPPGRDGVSSGNMGRQLLKSWLSPGCGEAHPAPRFPLEKPQRCELSMEPGQSHPGVCPFGRFWDQDLPLTLQAVSLPSRSRMERGRAGCTCCSRAADGRSREGVRGPCPCCWSTAAAVPLP